MAARYFVLVVRWWVSAAEDCGGVGGDGCPEEGLGDVGGGDRTLYVRNASGHFEFCLCLVVHIWRHQSMNTIRVCGGIQIRVDENVARWDTVFEVVPSLAT